MDGVILVVIAADGPMPLMRDHVQLAREAGVNWIVVLLNKSDLMDDAELLELMDIKTLELISKYEFSGEGPVVHGSALLALKNDQSEIGVPSLVKLCGHLEIWMRLMSSRGYAETWRWGFAGDTLVM
jgi:elongation factor Tu